MKLRTLEEFKEERKDLHDLWSKMTREQLLEEIWKESLDAVNMETRVAVFMQHATIDMSKTTYTPEVIIGLVNYKQEKDIYDFCQMTIEDSEGDDNYILNEVKTFAID